jgi:hypothetical protein
MEKDQVLGSLSHTQIWETKSLIEEDLAISNQQSGLGVAVAEAILKS